MTHCNTIIDGDSIEFCCETTHLLYLGLHDLTYLMQMSMTWHKLCKRVDDSNNRFAKLFMLHACGHPESAGASHSSSFSAYCTS